VAGFYDRAFLALPQEVLTTTLVHHQHYFPVVTGAGELKEAFLAVVNTQPQDERLIAKNAERVVTARLRDAKFFWESDQQTRLESRLDRLHTLLFHKKAGSYRDKAERISALAEWIAREPLGSPSEAAHAASAGRLAKADLTTSMVFEFTELQGTIGGIYARQEGLPEPVWKSIYYQYLPIGVEADAPPSREQLGTAAVTWAAVSLRGQDRHVCVAVDGRRTSDGFPDPFGLRRQTQGAVRVLMDLPQLTGIDREVSLGPILSPGGGWPCRMGWAGVGGGTRVCRRARALRARAARFAVEVVRAATPGGDVNPLRARRIAESHPGHPRLGRLSGAGGTVRSA
jgi:glycyl-tRNA synthetase beta chain